MYVKGKSMFGSKADESLKNKKPLRENQGIKDFQRRSAEAARERHNSESIEIQLGSLQRSADRADAWSERITETSK